MLLNEFLKEHRRVQDYERGLARQKQTAREQEATIHRLEALVTAQAKQIARLDASVQKVSARVELQDPTPRLTSSR